MLDADLPEHAVTLLRALDATDSIAEAALPFDSVALQKVIDWLALRGVHIEQIAGCDVPATVKLTHRVDLLDVVKIERRLKPSAAFSIRSLETLPSVGSTNERLMVAEWDDWAPGDVRVCTAEYQSEGRGRRGKSWVGAYGRNIYLSLGIVLDERVVLDGFSLMVGIVLAERIRDLGIGEVGVKWPNDVLINRRKVAGILVQAKSLGNGRRLIVPGIGINVVATSEFQAERIDQAWTSLEAEGMVDFGRNELIGVLVSDLLDNVERFAEGGFAAFSTRWQELDVLAGCPVSLNPVQAIAGGIVRGVDVDGSLLVEADGAVHRVLSADVSVRATSS
jgi:BirA family biotin operon repressor/biotin-[acetyl-CoA-carboxylase] ligase